MTQGTSWLIKYRTQIWIVLILALSSLSAYLIKGATQYGISLHADSYFYLTGSEQLARIGQYGRISGVGEFLPITHFPPLYSAALALIQKLGLAPYPSARVLNSLLFALTVLIGGFGIQLVTRSMFLSIFAASLIAASPVLQDMFAWAHSEPLYILISLGSLIALTMFVYKPRSRGLLTLSGLVAAAGILTRFIGASLILTGIVAILFLPREHPRNYRWRDAAIFAGISTVPVGIFLLRNVLLTGNATNRPAPFWHPPELGEWGDAARVILGWAFPDNVMGSAQPIAVTVTFTVVLTLVAILLYAGFRSFDRSSQRMSRDFFFVLLLYLLAYSSLVLITVFWFDTMTVLNQRILSPIYLPALMLLMLVIMKTWARAERALRWGLAGMCIILLVYQLGRSASMLNQLSSAPRGYASGIYRNSPTIEYLRNSPDGLIYSNDLPALYFWADKAAIYIPSRINPATLTHDSLEGYEASLSQMRIRLAQNNGLLVIFGPDPYSRLDQDEFSELTRGLRLVAEFQDGLIFRSD